MTQENRSDGRRPDQLRPVEIDGDYVIYPEGSVLFSSGKTRVLCNASIQSGVPRWMEKNGIKGGWLTAEYALLPRSTHQRVSRERLRPRGRTQEIRRLIGRSLRAALHMEQLPPVTLTLDCDVIQADGGTRTAAITGGYLALAMALGRAIEAGEMTREVFASPVAAVSVGIFEGRALLDLDYSEDSAAEVDANLVINAAGRYVEVQSTAESRAIPRVQLDRLLDLAELGISQLQAIQREFLLEAGFPELDDLWFVAAEE